jgi:prophage antirepressor-like protein
METNIQIFNNEQFGEIRVTEIDGKPYFVGSDVAKALGYTNPQKAIRDHCKGITKRSGVCQTTNQYGVTTNQAVEMSYITEGDIYRLAARSHLPGAEKFESWIFDEVIVSVANHGAYATPQTVEQMISDPDFAIKLLQSIKEEQIQRALLVREKYELAQQNAIMQPKAELMDKIMDTDQKIDIGQAAKILGLPFGRNTLFVKLREKGVFFKNRNEPKQEYIDKGYFELKEKWIDRYNHDGFMVVKVLVTQKGLDFIAKLFDVVSSKKQMAKFA